MRGSQPTISRTRREPTKCAMAGTFANVAGQGRVGTGQVRVGAGQGGTMAQYLDSKPSRCQ